MKRLIIIMTVLCMTQPLRAQIQNLWFADDGERIKNTYKNHWAKLQDKNLSALWYGDTIHLWGAANEFVAFQGQIEGGPAGVSLATAKIDSLHKPVGATNWFTIKNTTGSTDPFNYVGKHIEMFVMHYHTVASYSPWSQIAYNIPERTRATYNWLSTARPVDQFGKDSIFTGTAAIPDGLIPFEAANGPKAHGQGGAPFSVPANKLQGFWVKILINRDAEPGVYRGELKVYYNTNTLYRTVPIELTVYNFALPDTSTIQTSALLQLDVIAARHGLSFSSAANAAWAMVRKYQAFFYRHRVAAFGVPPVHAPAFSAADTSVFMAQQASIFNGLYFASGDSGYGGPGYGAKPNVLQVGGFDQPASFPGFQQNGPWSPGYPASIPGGDFFAMKVNAAGRAWSSTATYAVNDVVYNSMFPYWWYCIRAHTASSTRKPDTLHTDKDWRQIYERGENLGFTFDPDTTVMRNYWWATRDFYARFKALYNPTMKLMKYGPEEPNFEGNKPDTSAFADMRRKIRWLKTGPSGFTMEYRAASHFSRQTDPTKGGYNQFNINQHLDVIGFSSAAVGSGIIDSMAVWRARGKRFLHYTGGSRPWGGTNNLDAPAIDTRVNFWIDWKYGIKHQHLWFTLNLKDGSSTQINPWDRDYNYGGSAPIQTNGSYLWSSTVSYKAGQITEYLTYPHFYRAKSSPNVPPVGTVPTNTLYWDPIYADVKMGDGTMVYPGTDVKYPSDSRGLAGPVGTIRLENILRGAQDAEYLNLAWNMGIDTNQIKSVVDFAITGGFEQSGPVTDALGWHGTAWDTDIYHARRMEAGRKAIAALIESYSAPAPPPPGTSHKRRFGRKL